MVRRPADAAPTETQRPTHTEDDFAPLAICNNGYRTRPCRSGPGRTQHLARSSSCLLSLIPAEHKPLFGRGEWPCGASRRSERSTNSRVVELLLAAISDRSGPGAGDSHDEHTSQPVDQPSKQPALRVVERATQGLLRQPLERHLEDAAHRTFNLGRTGRGPIRPDARTRLGRSGPAISSPATPSGGHGPAKPAVPSTR